MNVPNVLYHLLSIMAFETQKGRDNFVSHHCLIKLFVEKSLHDVCDMICEEFLNVDQIRPEHLRPRVFPQPRRASRRSGMNKATPGASTSSPSSSASPVAAKQTINISSSQAKHSNRESSSLDSNDYVPLGILMRTSIQKKEAEIKKGKAKKKTARKKVPSSKKRKADSVLPIAEEEHESPLRKSRPIESAFGVSPMGSPWYLEKHHKRTQRPQWGR